MITRQCEHCGADFETYPSFVKNGGGRFCSRSCKSRQHWAERRSDSGYRREARPDHPLADSSGIVYVHRAVLYDKIGSGTHQCHWCDKPVVWKRYVRGDQGGVLVADHVDGNKQNNSPDNLVPSCFNCNKARLVRPRKPQPNAVQDGELFIIDKQGWRHRADVVVCEVCCVEFLTIKRKEPRRFCSITCSGIAKRKARDHQDQMTATTSAPNFTEE